MLEAIVFKLANSKEDIKSIEISRSSIRIDFVNRMPFDSKKEAIKYLEKMKQMYKNRDTKNSEGKYFKVYSKVEQDG